MATDSNFYDELPGIDFLQKNYQGKTWDNVPEINGHIHTPHSFSAFTNMEQAFVLSGEENIKALGINDFYTTDGYREFARLALRYKIFPLFNIEFMALQKGLQEAGIRVNDPNNPGRTYFSGKGLSFPVSMGGKSISAIKSIQEESNRQTYQMVDKLNEFLKNSDINIRFDARKMHNDLAKNLFRERHIAQAIRLAVFENEKSPEGRKGLLKKLFSGKDAQSPIDNIAALENEIRGKLLKAGGVAYVEESPEAFLSLEEVIDLIIDAGGIPCYPVLLDDPKGNYTDFEGNKEKLYQSLVEKNVFSIELIPGRNNYKDLKEFVTFFHQKGFIITFGTEHNTPKLDNLTISCRGGVPLGEELKVVNFEGAAIIAAHQYLKAKGEEGFLKGHTAKMDEKEKFISLGKSVISYFTDK